MVSKTATHIGLSLFFAILFFMPDLMFKLFHSEYFVYHIKLYKEFLGFVLLNFVLLSISQFKLKYFFYTLFMFFSFAELIHYSFFHSLIMPYEVPMFFEQSDEMLDTLEGVWGYLLLPVVIWLLMQIVLYKVLKSTQRWTLQGKKLPIYLTLFILIIGTVVATQRTQAFVFLPKVQSTSVKNMYNVLSWSVAKEVPKLLGSKGDLATFKPYAIKELNLTSPQTIVVVMGESLGAKYMSLFGFEKETTPKLKARKSTFSYTWGYSAGVNTDVAVPTFFALKREPKNNMVFLKDKTNLFALAKQKGYTTHYITTQRLTLMGSFLGDNVDVVLSKRDFQKRGNTYDEVLLEYLKHVDFTKKNFIVLHQRNSHSPYDKNTPKAYHQFTFDKDDYASYMRGTYYNSVLYTDTLLDSMMHVLDKQETSSVLFFTSDHSEMLGRQEEEGRFGHLYLGYADAKVPLISYYNSKAAYLKNILNLEGVFSHYDFSKRIANVLGKEIDNPNEDGSYYVNGVDIGGEQGYLTYRKKGKL